MNTNNESLAHSTLAPTRPPTFGQLRSQFLDRSKSRALSPVSEEIYRRDLDRVLRNTSLADTPVECVDARLIRNFIDWGLQNFSEPTVAQCLFTLKRMLRFAVSLGLIKRLPELPEFRLKRSRKIHPPVALSVEEFRSVVEEVKDEPSRTMLIVAGCLGLRANELAGLKWEDWSEDFSKLTVRRSFGSGFETPVNNSRHDSLVVSPEIAKILKGWRAKTQFNEDSNWVFANPRKEGRVPYDPKQIMAASIAPAASTAGIQKTVNWTVIRLSCAAMFMTLGVDIFTISRLMRHRSVLTTERYCRLPERERDAHASLTAVVLGNLSEEIQPKGLPKGTGENQQVRTQTNEKNTRR